MHCTRQQMTGQAYRRMNFEGHIHSTSRSRACRLLVTARNSPQGNGSRLIIPGGGNNSQNQQHSQSRIVLPGILLDLSLILVDSECRASVSTIICYDASTKREVGNNHLYVSSAHRFLSQLHSALFKQAETGKARRQTLTPRVCPLPAPRPFAHRQVSWMP